MELLMNILMVINLFWVFMISGIALKVGRLNLHPAIWFLGYIIPQATISIIYFFVK